MVLDTVNLKGRSFSDLAYAIYFFERSILSRTAADMIKVTKLTFAVILVSNICNRRGNVLLLLLFESALITVRNSAL